MIQIEELKFDEKGLIPAIVVDAVTQEVLTLAYMNAESLKITLEKGLTSMIGAVPSSPPKSTLSPTVLP